MQEKVLAVASDFKRQKKLTGHHTLQSAEVDVLQADELKSKTIGSIRGELEILLTS